MKRCLSRAIKWASHGGGKNINGGAAPHRVALVVAPPGYGKTHAAVEKLAADRQGIFYQPSHGAARERIAELSRAYKYNGNPKGSFAKDVSHLQGMGRRCSFLPRDEWAPQGWSFNEAACKGCKLRVGCPSHQQFWGLEDTTVKVATYAQQDYIGQAGEEVAILDELPPTIRHQEIDHELLARGVLPGAVSSGCDRWLDPIRGKLLEVIQALHDVACGRIPTRVEPGVDLPSKPEGMWPTPIRIPRAWRGRNRVRLLLDELWEYMEAKPPPTPNQALVRAGLLTPERWVPKMLQTLVELMRLEADEANLESDTRLLLFSWNVGIDKETGEDLCDWTLKVYKVQSPPFKNAVILDATAEYTIEELRILYQNHDFEVRRIEDPKDRARWLEHCTFTWYPTSCFTRSAGTFTADGKALSAIGFIRAARALRFLDLEAERRIAEGLADSSAPVGLIAPQAVLKSLGFELDDDGLGISDGDALTRWHPVKGSPANRVIQHLVHHRRLQVAARYYTRGLNMMEDANTLGVIGDPIRNIGEMRIGRRLRLNSVGMTNPRSDQVVTVFGTPVPREDHGIDPPAVYDENHSLVPHTDKTFYHRPDAEELPTYAEGVQEIHRARLINAGPGRAGKHVVWFGNRPPNTRWSVGGSVQIQRDPGSAKNRPAFPQEAGIVWKREVWPTGGRLVSDEVHEQQRIVVKAMDRGIDAFPGSLSQTLVDTGLHATYLGDLYKGLEATRYPRGFPGNKRDRNALIRAVAVEARRAGWGRFEMPHPTAKAKPMVVWAKDEAAFERYRDRLLAAVAALDRETRAKVDENAEAKEAEWDERCAIETVKEDPRKVAERLWHPARKRVLVGVSGERYDFTRFGVDWHPPPNMLRALADDLLAEAELREERTEPEPKGPSEPMSPFEAFRLYLPPEADEVFERLKPLPPPAIGHGHWKPTIEQPQKAKPPDDPLSMMADLIRRAKEELDDT